VKCKRCGRELSAGDSYQHLGETLCDDCYLDARSTPKPCDPWAVYTATRSRENLGLKGTEGLTELQRAIYEFVKDKGRTTREEMMTNFHIAQRDLESVVATLRHCELVRGQKEGDKVFLIPF